MLAHGSPEDRGELGALPVPLADERLVRGARGLLLPGPGLEHPERLGVLGLRVVDPAAAHPLLALLGAIEATPRGVLGHPSARAAVEASYDEEDPAPVADVVLGLIAAANAERGDYPWLADLALPDADGEWSPAGELLLPDSPLAGVVGADAPFGTVAKETLARYGAQTLAAAGVLSTFELLTAHDVDLDDPDLDLDGVQDWAYETTGGSPAAPCRRSRSRSWRYATWSSSTRTGGRGRWSCSRRRRCGRPSPSRPGSGWPAGATWT